MSNEYSGMNVASELTEHVTAGDLRLIMRSDAEGRPTSLDVFRNNLPVFVNMEGEFLERIVAAMAQLREQWSRPGSKSFRPGIVCPTHGYDETAKYGAYNTRCKSCDRVIRETEEAKKPLALATDPDASTDDPTETDSVPKSPAAVREEVEIPF